MRGGCYVCVCVCVWGGGAGRLAVAILHDDAEDYLSGDEQLDVHVLPLVGKHPSTPYQEGQRAIGTASSSSPTVRTAMTADEKVAERVAIGVAARSTFPRADSLPLSLSLFVGACRSPAWRRCVENGAHDSYYARKNALKHFPGSELMVSNERLKLVRVRGRSSV